MPVAVLPPAILPLGAAFPLCPLQSQPLGRRGWKSVPDFSQTAGKYPQCSQSGRALQAEDSGDVTCFIHNHSTRSHSQKNWTKPCGLSDPWCLHMRTSGNSNHAQLFLSPSLLQPVCRLTTCAITFSALIWRVLYFLDNSSILCEKTTCYFEYHHSIWLALYVCVP